MLTKKEIEDYRNYMEARRSEDDEVATFGTTICDMALRCEKAEAERDSALARVKEQEKQNITQDERIRHQREELSKMKARENSDAEANLAFEAGLKLQQERNAALSRVKEMEAELAHHRQGGNEMSKLDRIIKLACQDDCQHCGTKTCNDDCSLRLEFAAILAEPDDRVAELEALLDQVATCTSCMVVDDEIGAVDCYVIPIEEFDEVRKAKGEVK